YQICGAKKPPCPTEQIRVEPRLEVKRTLRVEHPFQRQWNHPRRGQWNEMTRHNESAIAVRAIQIVRSAAVEHGYMVALSRSVVGGAQAEDAGANDDYGLAVHSNSKSKAAEDCRTPKPVGISSAAILAKRLGVRQ